MRGEYGARHAPPPEGTYGARHGCTGFLGRAGVYELMVLTENASSDSRPPRVNPLSASREPTKNGTIDQKA